MLFFMPFPPVRGTLRDAAGSKAFRAPAHRCRPGAAFPGRELAQWRIERLRPRSNWRRSGIRHRLHLEERPVAIAGPILEMRAAAARATLPGPAVVAGC
jgi:hypothetical protein